MPRISRAQALACAAGLLVLLTIAGRVALGTGETPPAGATQSVALDVEEAPPRELVVHVAGAVLRPGLYRLPDGSRVDDAIAEAGGAKPKAALELVNLAAPVADGQQVLVPLRGSPQAADAGVTASGADAAGVKVHLNSATLEQLDQLPGVGPVTAQQILDYRAAHGAFRSVDELDAVPGIGPARLEQLRPLVDL
ncbi:MAG TPA: helix-hairpin-helix domain-containing protein [Gaiellaceae bacterium]|nr:helix-hairpin-helix domain-containing protein [Gaiellaceae bacterium]